MSRKIIWGLVALIAVVAVIGTAQAYTIKSKGAYGKSYEWWAARWTTWASKTPGSTNPSNYAYGDTLDSDGDRPWMLHPSRDDGGSYGVEYMSIPHGRPILFPVATAVAFIGVNGDTEAECRAYAAQQIALAGTPSLTINGDIVTPYHIQSDSFTVTLPSDNIYGLDAGTYTGVADGHFIMVNRGGTNPAILKVSMSGIGGSTDVDDVLGGFYAESYVIYPVK